MTIMLPPSAQTVYPATPTINTNDNSNLRIQRHDHAGRHRPL